MLSGNSKGINSDTVLKGPVYWAHLRVIVAGKMRSNNKAKTEDFTELLHNYS